MRRALPLAAALTTGCIAPVFELNQFGGGVARQNVPAALAVSAHTTVGVGVVPAEGAGVVVRADASAGVDGLRGGDHRFHLLVGGGYQPRRVTERLGWEVVAELGTTTFGHPAWSNLETGVRGVLSWGLARRSIAARNRAYSMVFGRLSVLFELRAGARWELDQQPAAAAGYVELGVGLRYRLGSDLL